eukprot:CAMPEP_0202688172 /NCGR_PEP_ID=MMETSP1385-20130828/3703_1 /ASSEMBLY_ACC=CAM_ASM_000861 /TAXON_ID=933848 /ORGANISM="Elphidium margaritaceum" /LENGTH=536 /DNA_ID=CAMNT_0049343079 /DNA_START=46 /DNA_END=1656 /DNA_ORIENTATION=+
MELEFEKARSYLSQQVDDCGTSIYSHIAAISRKIVEEKPENAYDLFENISLRIKQSKLDDASSNANGIQQLRIDETERQQIKANIDRVLSAYGRTPDSKPNSNLEEDDAVEDAQNEEQNQAEPIDVTKCADILRYEQMLKYAGISFDDEELYQLQCACVQLIRARGSDIANTRFWGKVHGTRQDYYIVEAKLNAYPEAAESVPAQQEQPGQGVNEFVYFVCTDLESASWTQLEDVSPEQIKKSREIYRLFTGDLSAQVGGRQHFEWNEAQLLRAQIARISCATVVAPAEYYQAAAEEEEENSFAVQLNEEFVPAEDGGASTDGWVHSRAHLRLEGRLQKWVEPENEDANEAETEEKTESQPTAESLEEQVPILQSLSNDTSAELVPPANSSDADNGDDEVDNAESRKCWFIRELNKNMPYQIVVVNNKLWGGAKTVYVANSKTFVNIYVGNGQKYRGQYYTPKAPAVIQSQYNEFKEVETANPDNEEETITTQQSIFVVQTEQMPPPPPPADDEENQENDANENENQNEETEQATS